MFKHIRVSEDWVLLTLLVLLAGFCLFAVAAQYWLLFVLCLPFIVVTLTILKKLSDARSCASCQLVRLKSAAVNQAWLTPL